jgi:hypothetical protein
MAILNAQTSGTLNTNSAQFTPIPGLSVKLPEGVNVLALVILNMPMSFAEGSNFPGATFGISVNGKTSPVVAGFTYATPIRRRRVSTACRPPWSSPCR